MSVDTEQIVYVTESARQVVFDMRAAEPDGDGLGLRIDVTGVSETGREFAYDLLFQPLEEADETVEVRDAGGLPVIVAVADVEKLRGASLDHTDAVGLLIRNPNRPETPKLGATVVLEGSVEEKVVALIDGEINPALAAHGGFAQLQRVEGSTAYVTMGGGCQGCGLASMTLREGITSQILERIPEITEVLDDTDHAAGDNPFYA
jgi:Fe/S biogenesis protein NfuA